MNSMYAKLFSRIAQSSLMEQDVPVRYCFMMLLAIADPVGDVIGTDVAIARTVNLPLDDFKRCIAALMQPDPDSNSQVHDGRRIVASANGRGYQLVNYVTYREIKTIEEKRTYMREYMRARRGSLKAKDVTAVKVGKVLLGDVTHAEAEAEGEANTEAEEENKPKAAKPFAPAAWNPSPDQLIVTSWFHRRPTTPWSEKEVKAFKAIHPELFEDGVKLLHAAYSVPHGDNHRTRKDLLTLLNNWQGEIDRWRSYKPPLRSDVQAVDDDEELGFLSNDDAIFHKTKP